MAVILFLIPYCRWHRDEEIVSKSIDLPDAPSHCYTYGEAAARTAQLAHALTRKLGVEVHSYYTFRELSRPRKACFLRSPGFSFGV